MIPKSLRLENINAMNMATEDLSESRNKIKAKTYNE